mmetsp:Transcript_41718/g.123792  ORF Transcript_41718/g.123792 Transcript_41718/m.123792 type:complete len:265 (-) Transcript_41718:4-798(-)
MPEGQGRVEREPGAVVREAGPVEAADEVRPEAVRDHERLQPLLGLLRHVQHGGALGPAEPLVAVRQDRVGLHFPELEREAEEAVGRVHHDRSVGRQLPAQGDGLLKRQHEGRVGRHRVEDHERGLRAQLLLQRGEERLVALQREVDLRLVQLHAALLGKLAEQLLGRPVGHGVGQRPMLGARIEPPLPGPHHRVHRHRGVWHGEQGLWPALQSVRKATGDVRHVREELAVQEAHRLPLDVLHPLPLALRRSPQRGGGGGTGQKN